MSFNFTATTARADVEVEVGLAVGRYQPGDYATDEVHEILGKVPAVAQAAADAIGQPSDVVLVSVSGHANPDHGKADGYSNEHLTVSVSVVNQ